MFELCEAKSGYVYNLEVYSTAHPTNSEHNTAVSVIDRLCDKIKGKGHSVYMDRWFSSPKIFHHLCACKTKAVGTVMSSRKEMPKEAFSVKLKKGEKISRQRDHLLAIKWKDTCDVFFLTSAHQDETVEAPSSRGTHKIKPTTVLDYNKYKTGVDRSDQMLSYYSLERKTIKWWKKLFFHLFDLAIVNAHILHTKTNKKKLLLEIFYEKLLKDCLLVPAQNLKYKVRPAVQQADSEGETIFYIGFLRHTLSWKESLSAHVACVQKEASTKPGRL
jgi:hypothetical protein